jgi:predicted DNA-binding WGR domain protein
VTEYLQGDVHALRLSPLDKAAVAKADPRPAVSRPGGERYFEFTAGASKKFWAIAQSAASHTVRFGRIGSDGQTKTKRFASAALAVADADKLMREKTGKGYVEMQKRA